MRYGRLSDLLRLALQMQGRADGLSLDEIGAGFEVSRRTAERMRDAILDSFPQTEEITEPGGRKRWRLPSGTTGRLTEPFLEEIGALHRGKELARQNGDGATLELLARLSDRLRAGLAAQKRTRLEPDIAVLLEADGVALRPGPREQIEPDTLNNLRLAILSGVWISADHRARATGQLSRNAFLGPLAMLLVWLIRQTDGPSIDGSEGLLGLGHLSLQNAYRWQGDRLSLLNSRGKAHLSFEVLALLTSSNARRRPAWPQLDKWSSANYPAEAR